MIRDYIHEYDFPVHDLFYPYKEDILNQYWDLLPINKDNTNNFLYQNPKLENIIIPLFLDILKHNYVVSPLVSPIKLWAYIQNNDNYFSKLHNHINTSTINATFYIDPPENGGELYFSMEDEECTIKPQKNKIYLFPYWLHHKPLSQSSSTYRICINLEYKCQSRPMHIPSKVIW
jgi:hypothetical protein